MLIDTHVHYNLEPLHEEWQKHWQLAQKNGVGGALVVGTSEETTLKALRLAEVEPQFRASVGIHPHVWQDWVLAGQTDQQLQRKLEELEFTLSEWTKHSKVRAIGETGLDWYRFATFPHEHHQRIKEWQIKSFLLHITLAKKHGLPLVIHLRDQGEAAYTQMVELAEAVPALPRCILHCVSGPLFYVRRMLELGAYVSVAGNVTYKSASAIRELLDIVPASRLLIETDAPYLPPHPFRGQICEPAMISHTAQYLEQELKKDISVCAENAQTCFNDHAWLGAHPQP